MRPSKDRVTANTRAYSLTDYYYKMPVFGLKLSIVSFFSSFSIIFNGIISDDETFLISYERCLHFPSYCSVCECR